MVVNFFYSSQVRTRNKMLEFVNLVNGTGVGRNSRPHVGALLRHGSRDGGSLHFAFIVHDHSGVVFEVDGRTIFAVERLRLTNNDAWHDLLTEFRLTLLHGSHEHVTGGGSWHSVQSTLVTDDGNDVQVLGTGDWASQGNVEFSSQGTSSSTLRHLVLVLFS